MVSQILRILSAATCSKRCYTGLVCSIDAQSRFQTVSRELGSGVTLRVLKSRIHIDVKDIIFN